MTVRRLTLQNGRQVLELYNDGRGQAYDTRTGDIIPDKDDDFTYYEKLMRGNRGVGYGSR